MTMSATVKQYLESQHVPYELVTHAGARGSLRTASVASIPAHRLAKAVMFEDEDGMLMAVLPADRRVQIGELRKQTGRNVGLTTEDTLSGRFFDCDLGAIPPLGDAYGIETIVDDELEGEPEVYLEAGDHKRLMRMRHDDFMRLMHNARHGHFAQPLGQ
jgi:Ala-tRNA(Pro) deacylase